MFLYSETINLFLKKLKARARFIMTNEMGLKMRRERYIWGTYSFPLSFVLFEDPKKLGYYDSRCFQIGLNKKLLYLAHQETIDNILRHELAHLYCFHSYGNSTQAHGVEYRQVCEKFGWDKEVYGASLNLDDERKIYQDDQEFNKVFERIQKLLSLASSSNEHEAQAATLKANQLLLKYNLKDMQKVHDHEEIVYVKRVYETKRTNAMINALYDILGNFYVRPIYNRVQGGVYLEVIGSKINVELADYIAKFLVGEFDYLWKKAQKENSWLKGIQKKNSFYQGLCDGFIRKLHQERNMVSESDQKALLKINQDLSKKVKIVYSRLGSSSRKANSTDEKAAQMGIMRGLGLSIRKGLTQNKDILSLPLNH